MAAKEPLDILAARLDHCLTMLEGQLRSSVSAGYADVRKRSEVIVRDLMNILYDKNLVLETKNNASGFDLCDTDNMLLVQVTSNHTIGKITECLRTTTERVAKEPWLCGFDLQILFLTTDSKTTSKLRTQTAAKLPKLGLDLSSISFDPLTDILDFNDLLKLLRENHVTQQQMAQLTDLMDKYWPLISIGTAPVDRVQEVIDQYIENFEAPLFMHRGSKTVTLKNLYVEPAFSDPAYAPAIPSLLEDFIHHRQQEKILLIEGGPAIGKTSLVSWMCYHHAHPTEDDNVGQTIFGDRSIVVVRLRELEFPPEKLKSDAILRYLNIPNAKAFAKRYPDTILILDGADELGLVSNARQNAIEDFILGAQQAFSPFKIIVTSRPNFLTADNLKSFQHSVRHVTLEHFDADRRAKWVENYKSTGETPAPETEAYILDISDEQADGVADTPLALYLLADCKMQEDYKDNQWALYHAIFSEAIMKAPYNAIPGSGPLMSSEHAAQNYNMVKAIAFRMFRNSGSNRFYINKEELDEIAQSIGLSAVDAERVKETCVLCAYWKDTKTGALEFYHNNIRDFFLAEYFCDELAEAFSKLPKVSGDQVDDSYFACPEWQALMEKLSNMFCWDNISHFTWQKVFSFIVLRLRSESLCPNYQNTLHYRFIEASALVRLMEFFPDTPFLWQSRKSIHPYQAAKITFHNVLILFHILLECKCKHKNTAFLIHYSNFACTLMYDWIDLFQNYILYPHVSVSPLAYTQLPHAVWERKCIYDVAFSNSDLSEIVFEQCTLARIVFCNTKIDGLHAVYSTLAQGSFSYSTIVGGDFICTPISEGTKFLHCNLDRCIFHRTMISDTEIKKCIISDTTFGYITFKNIVLKDCRIEGTGTTLTHCKFENITIENCTYRNVAPKVAEILRSIGFTEDNTPYERNHDNDSESDSV